MKKAILFFRSLLFSVGTLPIIIVFSLFSCTLGVLLPYRLRQEIVTIANTLIVIWLRITCGVKLKVEGLENLPRTPSVVASKHQSTWETYYLQRLLRPASTILKRELLKIPFFGWGLYFMHPIAIDRGNPRVAMKQVQSQGLARLQQGNNVLIFPEGTRVPFGEQGKYARSAASLALAANAPIVPIAHNAGYCWPSGEFLKKPGTIHMIIGAPIYPEGKDSRSLTEEVRHWIETTQQTLSH